MANAVADTFLRYFHISLAKYARALLHTFGKAPILILFDRDIKQEPIRREVVRPTEDLDLLTNE